MSDNQDQAPKGERRPYEPPKVIAEESFETRALSCANTPGQCAQGRGRGRPGGNRS